MWATVLRIAEKPSGDTNTTERAGGAPGAGRGREEDGSGIVARVPHHACPERPGQPRTRVDPEFVQPRHRRYVRPPLAHSTKWPNDEFGEPVIQLGIVGCGRATAELHLPALRRVPEIRVAALCDVDLTRATAAAGLLEGAAPAPAQFGDLGTMLAGVELNAVAVCTPPAEHAEAAVAALTAGKHVFVEKPLALSVGECDRISARHSALGTRRSAVVGFNLRQHRLLRRAKELVGAGGIGRPLLARSALTSDVGLTRQLPAWRNPGVYGGGVLFELASHHFDLWRWLLGVEIEEVFAWDAPSDDTHAVVSARLAGGVLATAQFGQRTYPAGDIELHGDRGRLRVSLYDFDGLEHRPLEQRPGRPLTRLKSIANTLESLPAGLVSARKGGDFLATYAEEWRRFADTVLRGAPPAASLEDGRAAVAASAAAVESASTGRPVRI